MKNGLLTTEFWLTVLAVIAGVALIVAGKDDIGGTIIATAIPGYALARGRAKAAV